MNTLIDLVPRYIEAQKTKNVSILESLFREMLISRNKIAIDKGFKDYVDLQVRLIYKIPPDHWQKYLKNKHFFANKFTPNLTDSTNSPHFLNRLSVVNVKYPDGVIDLVSGIFPEIDAILNKIVLDSSNKGASFRFNSENGKYLIFIPEVSHNQKVSMLIHEVSHAVNLERQKHIIDSPYLAEFEAHKIEFQIVKNISKDFLNAVIGEYLMSLVRTDFQISLFTNPELDLIEIYSKTFLEYIGALIPENKYDFFFDEKLTHTPLSDISSAVSLVNLLT